MNKFKPREFGSWVALIIRHIYEYIFIIPSGGVVFDIVDILNNKNGNYRESTNVLWNLSSNPVFVLQIEREKHTYKEVPIDWKDKLVS